MNGQVWAENESSCCTWNYCACTCLRTTLLKKNSNWNFAQGKEKIILSLNISQLPGFGSKTKSEALNKYLVLALTFSQIWLNPLVGEQHQPPISQNWKNRTMVNTNYFLGKYALRMQYRYSLYPAHKLCIIYVPMINRLKRDLQPVEFFLM
jgi:hypothetical protein